MIEEEKDNYILINAILNREPKRNIIQIINKNRNNEELLSFVSEDDGTTALIWACKSKYLDIAKLLVETGSSNPGAVDIEGNTALTILCQYNFISVNQNELTDLISSLINTGQANIGYYNDDLEINTALYYACGNGMEEVGLLLLNSGQSNPQYTFKRYNFTALILSCMRKLNNLCIELIRSGQSNPTQLDNLHLSALCHACHSGLNNVCSMLLDLNLPIDNFYNNALTALILACNKKMEDIALKIIETGNALVNFVSPTGISALFVSVINNLERVVNVLLNSNLLIDEIINRIDLDGLYPFDYVFINKIPYDSINIPNVNSIQYISIPIIKDFIVYYVNTDQFNNIIFTRNLDIICNNEILKRNVYTILNNINFLDKFNIYDYCNEPTETESQYIDIPILNTSNIISQPFTRSLRRRLESENENLNAENILNPQESQHIPIAVGTIIEEEDYYIDENGNRVIVPRTSTGEGELIPKRRDIGGKKNKTKKNKTKKTKKLKKRKTIKKKY